MLPEPAELVQEFYDDSSVTCFFARLYRHHQDSFFHSFRVGLEALSIGYDPLEEDQLLNLLKAGLLHDIDKLEIPLEILTKPGWLSADERELMISHPKLGYQLLDGLVIEPVRNAVVSHHEWQSKPYPRNENRSTEALGDQYAQLIAVVDHFDALTKPRDYKRAIPVPADLGIIEAECAADEKYLRSLIQRLD